MGICVCAGWDACKNCGFWARGQEKSPEICCKSSFSAILNNIWRKNFYWDQGKFGIWAQKIILPLKIQFYAILSDFWRKKSFLTWEPNEKIEIWAPKIIWPQIYSKNQFLWNLRLILKDYFLTKGPKVKFWREIFF